MGGNMVATCLLLQAGHKISVPTRYQRLTFLRRLQKHWAVLLEFLGVKGRVLSANFPPKLGKNLTRVVFLIWRHPLIRFNYDIWKHVNSINFLLCACWICKLPVTCLSGSGGTAVTQNLSSRRWCSQSKCLYLRVTGTMLN